MILGAGGSDGVVEVASGGVAFLARCFVVDWAKRPFTPVTADDLTILEDWVGEVGAGSEQGKIWKLCLFGDWFGVGGFLWMYFYYIELIIGRTRWGGVAGGGWSKWEGIKLSYTELTITSCHGELCVAYARTTYPTTHVFPIKKSPSIHSCRVYPYSHNRYKG